MSRRKPSATSTGPGVSPMSQRLSRRARAELARAIAVSRTPVSRIHSEPLFVLGNQRSGTTAVAALLAQATGETASLDLIREVFAPTFDRLRAGEMTIDDHVRRNRFSFSRTIIKEPHLTPFFPQLSQRFPHARFAMVVRDPRDNIRSLYDYLEVPGHTADPEFGGSRRIGRWRSWRLVVDSEWLGLNGATALEQLAHRWNLCADVYLDHQDSVVLVRYEDFVADRHAQIASLARMLGLGLLASDVADERARRPFQPPGNHRDEAPLEFFGPTNLATIERICGERMSALGYVPSVG